MAQHHKPRKRYSTPIGYGMNQPFSLIRILNHRDQMMQLGVNTTFLSKHLVRAHGCRGLRSSIDAMLRQEVCVFNSDVFRHMDRAFSDQRPLSPYKHMYGRHSGVCQQCDPRAWFTLQGMLPVPRTCVSSAQPHRILLYTPAAIIFHPATLLLRNSVSPSPECL